MIPASKLVGILALASSASANYLDTDKAKNVQNSELRLYPSQAECKASANQTETDYQELGACIPEDVLSSTSKWSKQEVNSTHFIKTIYNASGCAHVDSDQSAALTYALSTCINDNGQWFKNIGKNNAVTTIFSREYNVSGCPDANITEETYYGADICQPASGSWYQSEQRIAKGYSGSKFVHNKYAAASCSGTAANSTEYTAGAACTSHPVKNNTWMKVWLWAYNNDLAPPTKAPTKAPTKVNTTSAPTKAKAFSPATTATASAVAATACLAFAMLF